MTSRFGIEEEFFLVHQDNYKIVTRMPPDFIADCAAQFGERVTHEMLQSQIETVSSIHESEESALEELRTTRRQLGKLAKRHGLSLIAAGTYPLARWQAQRMTDKARYHLIMDDLQMLGRRNMLCGIHVHVEVRDPRKRINVMNRAIPFLPLLLGLSSSSPFWAGEATGLFSYRPSAYDELPRTGLPPAFASHAAYESYVRALVRSNVIPDASYIWWALRPSHRWPTVELRITDSCTFVHDTLTIATLFRCLVHRFLRDSTYGPRIDAVGRAIAEENRWRTQRYGIQAVLIDGMSGQSIGFADALRRMTDDLRVDAHMLGCTDPRERVERILTQGTSADGQIKRYDWARRRNMSHPQALKCVAEWLARRTLAGAAAI